MMIQSITYSVLEPFLDTMENIDIGYNRLITGPPASGGGGAGIYNFFKIPPRNHPCRGPWTTIDTHIFNKSSNTKIPTQHFP